MSGRADTRNRDTDKQEGNRKTEKQRAGKQRNRDLSGRMVTLVSALSDVTHAYRIQHDVVGHIVPLIGNIECISISRNGQGLAGPQASRPLPSLHESCHCRP